MKPLLYDVFCGAGGCTRGYQMAGFRVIGVDNRPQPRYCGEAFLQMDALEFLRRLAAGDYERPAAVHCSPPCQRYSRATAWRGDRSSHPDLIGEVQALLRAIGAPYVIENVEDAAHLLDNPIRLCGTAFGLPFRRHRYFEAPSLGVALIASCQHRPGDYSHDHGFKQRESVYRAALGCDWMTVHESRQAIPPAYTAFIGAQLLGAIQQ